MENITYDNLNVFQHNISPLLSQLRTTYNAYRQVKIHFHDDMGMEELKKQKAPNKS